MRAYRKYVNVILFIIIVFVSFNHDYNPFVTPQNYPAFVEADKTHDTLYKKIKEAAKNPEYAEEPQNAYIDRVWKKTPGMTGKAVNIEKSYQKMQSEGKFDDKLLVYDKVRPELTLKDLPPAPIYRGHPEKQMVSFMINVSWGGEHLPAILETLREHKIKASFFIEGKWARENAELVKIIAHEGHLIGSHAYSHPDMSRLNSTDILKELTTTNEVLTAITSKEPQYFTPPSGSYTDEVVEKAAGLNMETILWTADTVDWKNPSVSVMINRVSNAIHPGAIILMHPTPVIAEGLSELIENTKKQDYKIGRIDRLLDEEK